MSLLFTNNTTGEEVLSELGYPIDCSVCKKEINQDFYFTYMYQNYEMDFIGHAICSNCYPNIQKVSFKEYYKNVERN